MQLESNDRFSSDHSISEIDVYEFCLDFIQQNEFEFFSLLDVTPKENSTLSESLILSNWPNYFIKLCEKAGTWRELPWFKQSEYRENPIVFEASKFPACPANIYQLIKRTGLDFSIGYNLKLKSGKLGSVVFSCRKRPDHFPDVSAVLDYSSRIFDKRTLAGVEAQVGTKPLSKREHECLLWTSQGKTSYEIGMILDLSENTINNYLVSAGRKLRAVNRPHMVSIALRSGIIE